MKNVLLAFILFFFAAPVFAATLSHDTIRTKALPGTVTLSFDDGPSPIYTPQILAVLKQYHVKATFFVMGALAEKYPYLIREIAADGHVVSIHTQTHPMLTKLSNAKLYDEVVQPRDIVTKILGYAPMCLRPPYGVSNTRVRNYIRSKDLIPVPMGFNSFDYERGGVQKIAHWVIKNARSGMVVLLHDGYSKREETVEALPLIIQGIRKKGLGFSVICRNPQEIQKK